MFHVLESKYGREEAVSQIVGKEHCILKIEEQLLLENARKIIQLLG